MQTTGDHSDQRHSKEVLMGMAYTFFTASGRIKSNLCTPEGARGARVFYMLVQ